MLDPRTDRTDYGEFLIPPPGYDLTFAAGTTYSLDLEALLIIPVALFHSRLLDCSPDDIRYDIFDSITKVSKKIVVYCQKGKIKVPDKYNFLLAHWEKGIEEITLDNYAQSFHPKVWVIRYDSEKGDTVYKILLTSRNLTFSRDWDLAFNSQGYVENESIPENQPLVDFLNYLSAKGSNPLPESFINDLKKVRFDVPDGFSRLRFYPIGFEKKERGEKYTNPVPDQNWNDLLILSPFVDGSTIKKLRTRTSGDVWLFSRKEELDKVNCEEIERLKPFKFSRIIRDAESLEMFSEGNNIPRSQDIHAKLFIGTKRNSAYWYLGSANATSPAYERNVEFLVELKEDNGLKRPKGIAKFLTTEKDNVVYFEPYTYKEKEDQQGEDEIDNKIRKIIYNLVYISVDAKVSKDEATSLYNFIITADASSLELPRGFEAAIRPLSALNDNPKIIIPGIINVIDDFKEFSETELSGFAVWDVMYNGETKNQFIVKMSIELPETRFNKIFSAIIDSRDKFFKYIGFLLSEDEAEKITGNGPPGRVKRSNEFFSNWEIPGVPVFEKLLIAASRHPQKLRDINKLIENLEAEDTDGKPSLITPEFKYFWSSFFNYIEGIK